MDHHHLVGAQQPLRDDQRTQCLLRAPTRVADHVRVALLEPEHPRWQQAGIHASDHRDVPRRRHRQASLVERRGIPLVGLNELVDQRHWLHLRKAGTSLPGVGYLIRNHCIHSCGMQVIPRRAHRRPGDARATRSAGPRRRSGAALHGSTSVAGNLGATLAGMIRAMIAGRARGSCSNAEWPRGRPAAPWPALLRAACSEITDLRNRRARPARHRAPDQTGCWRRPRPAVELGMPASARSSWRPPRPAARAGSSGARGGSPPRRRPGRNPGAGRGIGPNSTGPRNGV